MHYKYREKRQGKASRALNSGDYVCLVGAEKASKFSRAFHIQNTEEIFKICKRGLSTISIDLYLERFIQSTHSRFILQRGTCQISAPGRFPHPHKEIKRFKQTKTGLCILADISFGPRRLDRRTRYFPMTLNPPTKRTKAHPLAFVQKDLVFLA